MQKCKNTVKQWITSGWSYIERKSPCGSIGIDGRQLLCSACTKKAVKEYPQGWVNIPGDVCKHGTYIGDRSEPDYTCRRCENE